jgi:tripartite-type tricarboxylate transporter receptor subunit TctC
MIRSLLVAVLALFASTVSAQGTYPDHPIRMILPFSAGGGTDAVGRIVAKALSERLKQQVIVDNRAGAGSTIGTDAVAKAAPDGYTLLFASASHSFSPTVYPKLPYSQDDFAPIAIVNITPLMLTINPAVPAKDLKSFIALLKANPGKYTYASSGVGTTLHIAAEHFVTAAGVNVVHVPYKGEAPAMTDLVGGQVNFMVGQASTAVPYVKNGRLIGIGLTTPKRWPRSPTFPRFRRRGCPASLDTAGTPYSHRRERRARSSTSSIARSTRSSRVPMCKPSLRSSGSTCSSRRRRNRRRLSSMPRPPNGRP